MEDTVPVEVVPAILPANREELHKAVQLVLPFAKTVQLDVVDGIFNAHVTWPYTLPGETVAGYDDLALPSTIELYWEVHLMTREPRTVGKRFIAMGAKRLIVHIETLTNVDMAREAFEAWHAAGVQVAVSLLLDTPISAIEEVIHDVEAVQIMSIAEIGAQGYSFDARAIVRVQELRNRYPHVVISVDGGINMTNAVELVRAGANRLCVGSAILKAEDPQAAYNDIKRAVNSLQQTESTSDSL